MKGHEGEFGIVLLGLFQKRHTETNSDKQALIGMVVNAKHADRGQVQRIASIANRIWGFARHLLSIRSLLDLFGWKDWLWTSLTSALASAATWRMHSSIWAVVPVGIVEFCIVALIRIAIRMERAALPASLDPKLPNEKHEALCFVTALYGRPEAMPVTAFDGETSWITVVNPGSVAAKEVVVRLDFKNESGTEHFTIPQAWCYHILKMGSTISTGWESVVSIESGEEQSFLLFVSDENDNISLVRQRRFAYLGSGKWEVTATVEARNFQGAEATFEIVITKNGWHHGPMAVQRKVSTRLSAKAGS